MLIVTQGKSIQITNRRTLALSYAEGATSDMLVKDDTEVNTGEITENTNLMFQNVFRDGDE